MAATLVPQASVARRPRRAAAWRAAAEEGYFAAANRSATLSQSTTFHHALR